MTDEKKNNEQLPMPNAPKLLPLGDTRRWRNKGGIEKEAPKCFDMRRQSDVSPFVLLRSLQIRHEFVFFYDASYYSRCVIRIISIS
jgi:hypothetical protein